MYLIKKIKRYIDVEKSEAGNKKKKEEKNKFYVLENVSSNDHLMLNGLTLKCCLCEVSWGLRKAF